jgi:hypothetical protein
MIQLVLAQLYPLTRYSAFHPLAEYRDNGGSESPTKDLRKSPKRQRFLGGGISMGGMGIVRDYGDLFVPFKDSGDLRNSYHLMEEGGVLLLQNPGLYSQSLMLLKASTYCLSYIARS